MVDKVVKAVKEDKGLGAKLLKDPVKTLENILGVDLPDEKVQQIVKSVKEKLNLNAGGFLAKIKAFFKGQS